MTLLFPGRQRKGHRRSKRPREERPRRPRLLWLRNLRLSLAAHPRRAVALGAVGLLLIGFIAVSSLPMALAESYPRLALLLYLNHPQALMALAREDQRALAATLPPPREAILSAEAETRIAVGSPSDPAAANSSSEPATNLPADAEKEVDPATTPPDPALAAEQHTLRLSIQDLASRAIAQAPLTAEAYRMLGARSDNLEAGRQSMIDAVARSRRETVAAFWLMHQDYERGDYEGVVRMAGIVLQTRPALDRFTLSYLNSLVLTPQGREALVAALVAGPSWRVLFLSRLGQQLATSDAPLALFQQLKAAGSPPTETELAPFLWARMLTDKAAGAAYNVWLQLLPGDELTNVGPVNNLDFAEEPSTLPFNWMVPRSVNAFVDFLPRTEAKSGRALRVRFGIGRVKLGAISQVTFLQPGAYRFTGMQKGNMAAKRGLRWQMMCYSSGRVVGQSDQLMGAPREWREFSFDIAISDDGRCDAQTLRLIHDSRSASEEFVTGEILFESLRIERVEAPNTATTGEPD